MWKRLFPKGFLQAAQTKQVVCHVCLKACITSWGKDFSLQLLSHSGAEWREIAVFEIRGESLWSSLEGVR